jgi:hypothetical protein
MKKALLITISFFILSPACYGYFDPGSTMLLLQGLLALIGGIVYYVKNPIKAIKSLIARIKNKNNA